MQAGDRFGKLTVIERAGNLYGKPAWNCRCDCGGTCVASGKEMRRGRIVSCGCVRSRNNLRHGHCRDGVESPTYKAWEDMVRRATNPRSRYFARCGGRGVALDPNWATFEGFLADMGECPPGSCIRKTGTDSPYTKETCRWVERRPSPLPE